MVGASGFEPPTPCTPCRCATRLRYAPIGASIPRTPICHKAWHEHHEANRAMFCYVLPCPTEGATISWDSLGGFKKRNTRPETNIIHNPNHQITLMLTPNSNM